MSLHRISVVSGLLVAVGGAVALADPNPLFPQTVAQNLESPGRAERPHSRLMQELNLTSEQMQKMQEIRSQYQGEISQDQQALRQATLELRDLLAGTASVEEIRAKHREVQALQQQLGESRFESTLAMREVLTPSQRREFAEMMQQRQEDFRNQMRNRRGPQF